jgi:hypothetical protein
MQFSREWQDSTGEFACCALGGLVAQPNGPPALGGHWQSTARRIRLASREDDSQYTLPFPGNDVVGCRAPEAHIVLYALAHVFHFVIPKGVQHLPDKAAITGPRTITTHISPLPACLLKRYEHDSGRPLLAGRCGQRRERHRNPWRDASRRLEASLPPNRVAETAARVCPLPRPSLLRVRKVLTIFLETSPLLRA